MMLQHMVASSVPLSDYQRVCAELDAVKRNLAETESLLARAEAQLAALMPDGGFQVPLDWGLRPSERAFLKVLMTGRLIDSERLHALIYGARDDGGPSLKMVQVIICHLRQDLRRVALDRVIVTRYGEGYYIPPEARARILAAAKACEAVS